MLERLKGSLDKGIAAVSVKSENLVETSRTKTAINNAQKAMDVELTNLGRRLYADWKNGAVDLNGYVADIERIMQIDHDIEAYKYRLDEIKREENRILGNQSYGGSSASYGEPYAAPYGGQSYGEQYGNQYGNQNGNQYGNQHANQHGNQYSNQYGEQSGTFCSNCGRQVPSGSRFCDGCGNQVD